MIHTQQILSFEVYNSILDALKNELYESYKIPFTLSTGGDEDSMLVGIVVYEANKPKGCVQLYHNPEIKHNKLKTILLGNYECVLSRDVSDRLINSALDYARSNGFGYVIGPINGSTWYNYRFKLENNLPNFFLEPYHKDYYVEQFVDCKFNPIANYISAIDSELFTGKESLIRIQKSLKKNAVVFRNIDKDKIELELKQIHRLSLNAFENNPYFAPIEWLKFWAKNKSLTENINTDLFIVACFKEEIIGYIFSIDNHFYQNGKQAVLKTLAVKSDIRFRGVGFILLEKLNAYLKSNNYTSLIHAFMFEDNNVIRMSQKYAHTELSRYVLLGRQI